MGGKDEMEGTKGDVGVLVSDGVTVLLQRCQYMAKRRGTAKLKRWDGRYLSEEHVGRETTFGGIGVCEHKVSALFIFERKRSSEKGYTFLCSLLPLTFGFDFFWHVCGRFTTQFPNLFPSDDDE